MSSDAQHDVDISLVHVSTMTEHPHAHLSEKEAVVTKYILAC